ncbi:MAG: RDD family protein [Lachnospiraceae bacterium]|nr:RDD family protein [Lachnospiraceae bacterium]
MEAGCQCIMQSHNNVSYAGAGVRFCAYIIDQIILLMVIGMLAGVFAVLGMMGLDVVLDYKLLFHFTVSAIIYFIVKKIYFIAFTYTSGQTIGKKVFRIKVVNDDLTKASFWRVFYREVIGRYLCGLKEFVWIGYLIMFLDEEKRGAHDRLSDTRVVYDSYINNEEVSEKAIYNEQMNRNLEELKASTKSATDESDEIMGMTTIVSEDENIADMDTYESALEPAIMEDEVNPVEDNLEGRDGDFEISEIVQENITDAVTEDNHMEEKPSIEQNLDTAEKLDDVSKVEKLIDDMAADINSNIDAIINEDNK